MNYLIRLVLLFAFGVVSLQAKEPDPSVIVIFGATGDLTARKLVPAIYHLAKEGYISDKTVVVGFARGEHTHHSFREGMSNALDKFSRTKKDNEFWDQFKNRIFYNRSEFESDQGYEDLKKLLDQIDREYGTQGNRIFYLSTQPSYFSPIVKKLAEHQLIYAPNQDKWSRVIIEKPFGKDLNSAIQLQKDLSESLDESQIYRMDHYLGKEAVLNLFTLRFESGFFEPMWNNQYIDNVQITMSEDIGIGSRARLWEEVGALRDFFQNHLMQLLAVIAMDAPAKLEPDLIHHEKIKVLNQIRPFPMEHLEDFIVAGQYVKGNVNGQKVLGYLEENGVPKDSQATTFIAAKLFIDNPRWDGVPFYIRGGKRMAKQTVEIVVTFKNQANALFIRIQPKAGIFLKTLSKVPGIDNSHDAVVFGFKPEEHFAKTGSEAYEKLIFDCMQGNDSTYVHVEEQLASWRTLDPVQKRWAEQPHVELYESGSWGPASADRLIERLGHKWLTLEGL